MAETLFALDERNYRECESLFRGQRAQEYYTGHYWIEDGAVIDVRAERKPVGPCAIIRLRSATRLHFRRSQQHIRADRTDLAVLWFVKRGRLTVTNQHGTRIAQPGDFVVTRSNTPFYIECRPDDEQMHEVLHVTLPAHVLRSFAPQDLSQGLFLPVRRRELAIAENLFTDLFEDEGDLAEDTARALMDMALTLVAHALRAGEAAQPVRRSVAERRLQDVRRFIEVHLADPNLSTGMVSRGCGISPRYLSFVLRLGGTSFSELVWQQRLEKAREWLGAAGPRQISISEIAYGVGFKSPAHFSRMFKRVFNVNPSACRPSECRPLERRDSALGGNPPELLH